MAASAPLAKHQYSVSVELAAPIEDCFEAGYLEEAMMSWVPNSKSIVYDHSAAAFPYGPGSSRKVTLAPGTTVVEVICVSEKPTLLGYGIPHFGFGVDAVMKNYQGRMHFEALGPARTRLTWKGYFDCPGWRVVFEPLLRVAMRQLISTMAHKMPPYLAARSKAQSRQI